jgi:single-stranded DNA-binding protein
MADQKVSYQDNKLTLVGNVANAPTHKMVSVAGAEKAISEFRLINHRADTMTVVTIKAWGDDLAAKAAALPVGALVKIEGSLGIRRNKNAEGQTFTEVNLNAKAIQPLAMPKSKAPAAEEALL